VEQDGTRAPRVSHQSCAQLCSLLTCSASSHLREGRTLGMRPGWWSRPAPAARDFFCRSRTSIRYSSSNATSATCAAGRSQPSPPWVSPAQNPTRQAPPIWPDTSGNSGRSNPSTGSGTPSTRKTNPRSKPDPDPESWPRSATWRSEPSDWLDAPISPKPPDGQHAV
jgi:hypothetical protein